MPNQMVMVVAASAFDQSDAQLIASEIDRRGLRTWHSERSTEIGDSFFASLETALTESATLILVRTGGADYDAWAALQERAFNFKVRFGGPFRVILVPRGGAILSPLLESKAIVLPPDLDPKVAAEACVNVIKKGWTGLASGSWIQLPKLATSYGKYVDAITSLIELKEYEASRELYWKTLHYSGYKEHWEQRRLVSEKLLVLSRECRDELNAAMVSLKGISYAQIETGQTRHAIRTITAAYRIFRDSSNRRGESLCWNYVGDLYAKLGMDRKALQAYARARDGLFGEERDEVALKSGFVKAARLELGSKKRHEELLLLDREFRSMFNYRAGLVEMEIARGLRERGGQVEALDYANAAVLLFRDTIGMPRNLIKAYGLQNALMACTNEQ